MAGCYVDDIFALFSCPDHADKFREYLSSKHPNINFSVEKEKDGCLLFQMLTFFMKTRNLQLSTEKRLLVGFIPTSNCSDFIKFHHEIDTLKSILYKNSYPRDLIDKCIREFLDKMLAPKLVVSTVPKKDLLIALPYLGKLSLQIRTRINHIMKNKLLYCNV